jgi:hypothetical protein
MAPIFAMCSFRRNNTREKELEWYDQGGGEKGTGKSDVG